MIAYVLPTRDRPGPLARTLDALGRLPPHDAEVVIVDNASRPPPHAPVTLPNGLHVSLVMRASNEGAAARNAGVRAADPSCEWVVMLDDDSCPMDLEFLPVLRRQPSDVAAVAAEVQLGGPSRTRLVRESGGLPEVFIGCGVAVRRQAFLNARGYDPLFHYYAEEYDLAARFMLGGMRIALDRGFRVLHEKTSGGRSMNRILRRLVRNNAWVMQRYAPARERSGEVRRTIARYGRIAARERALPGYLRGLADLAFTLPGQQQREMPAALWDRFTGKSVCRRSLLKAWSERRFSSAAIIEPGKNEHVVHACLEEMGVSVVPHDRDPEVLVIGTLSPGPLLDAWDAYSADPRVVSPWSSLTARSAPAVPTAARTAA